MGSGLEGLKKIIYEVVKSGQLTKIKKTVSANGNIITYSYYEEGIDDGTVLPFYITDQHETPGQGWGHGNQSYGYKGYDFHMDQIFPNDYRDWTAENFYFILDIHRPKCYHGGSNNIFTREKDLADCTERTYNPATGILSFPKVTSYAEEVGGIDPGATDGYVKIYVEQWELLIIG